MAIDQGVLDAVATANVKVMSDLPLQNAISNQQNVNTIAQKALAKSLEAMDSLSVPEGLGISAAQRGDLAKVMTELLAAVKAGGIVPPVTA